jgi:hypothetical protein
VTGNLSFLRLQILGQTFGVFDWGFWGEVWEFVFLASYQVRLLIQGPDWELLLLRQGIVYSASTYPTCYSTLGRQGSKQIYPGSFLSWEVGALADIHLGGPGDRSSGQAGKAVL